MTTSTPSVAPTLAQAIRLAALPCLAAIAFAGCAAPYDDEPLTDESASTTGATEAEDALVFHELSEASDVPRVADVWAASKWALPAQDLWNIDAHLRIEGEAPASARYEYVRRGYFTGVGHNFEISLQTHGGNKDKKLAVFSIENAPSAQAGGSGSWCKYYSDANGKGRSCQMYYDWQPGHTYRFRIWRGEANRWMAFVRDEDTQKEVYLGSIQAPAGTGSLLPWVQDFTRNQELLPACGATPNTTAVFYPPTGNNGTFTGVPHSADTGEHCFGHALSFAHEEQAVHELNRDCGGLDVGQELRRHHGIRSCNGLYTLMHQDDGNVVLSGPSGTLWESDTAEIAKAIPCGASYCETQTLVMQSDGNLVLYSEALMPIWASDGKTYSEGFIPLWASDTDGHSGAVLHLRDDGNLVIMHNGSVIWTSNTAQ